MLFSSGFFLTFFLPVVLIAYWLVPTYLRNSLLLLVSLFFYAWGEPLFVFVLLAITLLNYWMVRMMDESPHRKQWLVGYIVLNLGVLIAFKYINFFISIIAELAGWQYTADQQGIIPLPLGISFYAFHAITYGVDVYRRLFPAQRRADHFALYLFLFPHLIAGPIVAYKTIAAEIESRVLDMDGLLQGLYRFCVGLAKKVILSNGLILLIEACDREQLLGHGSSTISWIEMLAYTFHIYFDFSGYSDMAIGLGRMFGFHFPENFNRPYTSKSITEFWQRWHITLGYFMKNYLYIPLGGNKVSTGRLYFNLFLVFFLSGLWHGAAAKFVLWGCFHGAWLIIDRIFLKKALDKAGFIASFFTFIIVLNGWVLFHEPDLHHSISTFQSLWSFQFRDLPVVDNLVYFAGLLLICAAIILLEFVTPLQRLAITWRESRTVALQLSRFVWMTVIYLLSYAYVAAGSYNPFIYFNF